MNRFDALEKEVAQLKTTIGWLSDQLKAKEPQGIVVADDDLHLLIQLGGFGKPRRIFGVVAIEVEERR